MKNDTIQNKRYGSRNGDNTVRGRIASKDLIKEMIDGANYNIQKDFVPIEFDMYDPLIERDNTKTPLSPQ